MGLGEITDRHCQISTGMEETSLSCSSGDPDETALEERP